jgi:hypothetical protein
MKLQGLESDHLYTWSENNEGKCPPPRYENGAALLLRQLPPLQAILRGSLIERYKPCGKPGCQYAHAAPPRKRKKRIDK